MAEDNDETAQSPEVDPSYRSIATIVLQSDEPDLPSQYRTDSDQEVGERLEAFRAVHRAITGAKRNEAELTRRFEESAKAWLPPEWPTGTQTESSTGIAVASSGDAGEVSNAIGSEADGKDQAD